MPPKASVASTVPSADADAARGKRRRQLAGPRVELRVGETRFAVDDGDMLGMHARRAFEEHERSQRLVIRRIALKSDVIDTGFARPCFRFAWAARALFCAGFAFWHGGARETKETMPVGQAAL